MVVPPVTAAEKWLLWCPTAKAGTTDIGELLRRNTYRSGGRRDRVDHRVGEEGGHLKTARNRTTELDSWLDRPFGLKRESIGKLYPAVLYAKDLSEEQRKAACGPGALVSLVVRRNVRRPMRLEPAQGTPI